jgi:hypothetical protein
MLRRLLAAALAPAAAALLVLALPGALADLAGQPGARLLVRVLREATWLLPAGIALLAGWHDRSRLVFGALTLGAAAWALSPGGAGLDAGEALVGRVLIVAVGGAFLGIAPLEERGVRSRSAAS